MPYSTIIYEVDDRVAWITLNRPRKLNSLTPELCREFPNAVAEADRDPDVRVIVLKGAGDRAFSTGYDLGEEGKERDQQKVLEDWSSFVHTVWHCSKPVIAMINGYCLAGAMDLIQMCDIRYCSDDARFGAVEVRFAKSLLTLPALTSVVGQRCRELIYTGDAFDAEEAYRLGLVSRLFPKERLEEEVTRIAKRMSRVALPTLTWTKRALNNTLVAAGFDAAMQYSLQANLAMENSDSEFKHFLELTRTDVKSAIKWREAIFAPFESETSALSGSTKPKQSTSTK